MAKLKPDYINWVLNLNAQQVHTEIALDERLTNVVIGAVVNMQQFIILHPPNIKNPYCLPIFVFSLYLCLHEN